MPLNKLRYAAHPPSCLQTVTAQHALACPRIISVLLQERLSDMEDNTRQLPTLQSVQHSKSQSRIGSIPGNHSPDVTVNTPLLDPEGVRLSPVPSEHAHQCAIAAAHGSVMIHISVVQ